MKRSRGEMSSLSGAGAYIIRPWRDCSIISISRVKRAGPRPLTWFRFDSHSCSAYTYSRGGTMRGATRNVEKGTRARTRARAWPPLAARERAPLHRGKQKEESHRSREEVACSKSGLSGMLVSRARRPRNGDFHRSRCVRRSTFVSGEKFGPGRWTEISQGTASFSN